MSPEKTVPPMLQRLRQAHPDARYELNWTTPFELLVATILAAQCTDERVNRVTATLFQKYRGPQAFVVGRHGGARGGPQAHRLLQAEGQVGADDEPRAAGSVRRRGAPLHRRDGEAAGRGAQDGERGAQHRLQHSLGRHRRHPCGARQPAHGAVHQRQARADRAGPDAARPPGPVDLLRARHRAPWPLHVHGQEAQVRRSAR